jgi:hypothetical protein
MYSCIAHDNWCCCCCCPGFLDFYLLSLWGASTPPCISKEVEVKEGNWVGYSMILIRTLSIFLYFTDIANYDLESTTWSSRILWMVDWIVANPSFSLLSLCGVVPQVPIVISNPPSAWQVIRCWVIWIFFVRNKFAEYSISWTKYSSTKSLSYFSPSWLNRGTA